MNDSHGNGTPIAWHSLEADEALARLGSRRTGLTATEAAERLLTYGPNALPEPARTSPLLRFLAQFNSALIYFLLAAALAAGLLGHAVDAGVILALVVVNGAIGFLQEGKAEQALDSIRTLVSPQATVLRDGERKAIPAQELVPGDVFLLEPGDRAPADGRLLHARGLTVDEAILTGESVGATKAEGVVAVQAEISERSSMIHSGAIVTTGHAVVLATATGAATCIGEIGGLVAQAEDLTTPLLRRLNRFARLFSLLVFAAAVALFVFTVAVRGFDWTDALIAVVALSVGAIPEGLPAVITITLAVGVQSMAARKAVIRRLPAVETLGAVSVICTDKTGTLTRNEMTVRRIAAPGHELHVSGSGYAPDGVLSTVGRGRNHGHDDDTAALAAAAPLLRCGVLCNDARLHKKGGDWTVDGDAMDGALLVLARKAGLEPRHVAAEWPRLDEFPFDAGHRFMATLHRGPDGTHVIAAKGAPEAILAMCGVTAPVAEWNALVERAAQAGERVLGFASKTVPAETKRLSAEDLKSGFEPLGLMGFIDPPRNEAADAIAQCFSAGIEVKMITGDHVATACAVARQIGLAAEPKALTGAEIEGMDEADLAEAVETVQVFARATPLHKLRIVRALQARGRIVAMTGDGVNDSPALKQADVGVAMGVKGTEAARQSSEMVLLDDHFASIVSAVREGRIVHDNIRKVIAWTLPTNGGETAAVILAMLAGFTLPLTATQILWVNLVTAATLGLVLAFEPAESGVMQRPPRRPEAPLLSRFLVWRIAFVSALFAAAVLSVFFGSLRFGASLETARTLAVNTLIAAEAFYLFNVRLLHARSLAWRHALGTRPVLIALALLAAAQVLFTYAPTMNALLESEPLGWELIPVPVCVGFMLMLIIEGEKLLFRRLGWLSPARG